MTPIPLLGLGFFFRVPYQMAVTKISPGCNNIVTNEHCRNTGCDAYGWRRREAHSSLWAPNLSNCGNCAVWGRESDAATTLKEGRSMNPTPPITMVLSLYIAASV